MIVAFVVAIAVRVPSLDLPLIEWHGWRQTWTAYTALIYHERGIDLLHPQLPIFGPPFEVPMEFPIFQALAALAMSAGVAPDLAVRVTCLVTFVAAAVVLWGLARRIAGAVAAFAALLFFLFIPENLLWSRAGMIEYIPIAGAAGFLWAGIAWREDRRWSLYAVAMIAGIVGMLAKPTTPIFWTLPLVLWRIPAEGEDLGDWIRARLDPLLIALCIVPTLVALAWTAHADAIKGSQEAAAFMTSSATRPFYYASLDERLDPAIWTRTWSWVSGYVFGAWLIPVLALGLVVALRARRPLFWVGLCLAAILPFAIFYGGYYKHDYYWVAVTPQVATIFGLGVAWLVARARGPVARRRRRLDPGRVRALARVGTRVLVAHVPDALGLRAGAPARARARVAQRPRRPRRGDRTRVRPGPRVLRAAADAHARDRERDRSSGVASAARRLPHRVELGSDRGSDLGAPRVALVWVARSPDVRGRRQRGRAPRRAGRATDDPASIASVIRGRAPMLARSLRVPCDGASHPVPAGVGGTWLQLQADGSARVTVNALLAPLPGRAVIAFTPQAVYRSRERRAHAQRDAGDRHRSRLRRAAAVGDRPTSWRARRGVSAPRRAPREPVCARRARPACGP